MIFVKVASASVRPAVLVLATATVVAVASASSYGVEPADPELIPEAREVLDYFVKERRLHNLIWVYSAALKAGDNGKDVETIDYRKRFYPGDRYVDISGIDIYTNSWYGWGDFREDAFPEAFEIMSQVTPGKMLALCECQGLPNPEIIAKQGPHWLYCLPWYVGKDPKWNPPDWVKTVHSHEVFVTLDRLPKWTMREEQSK